MATSYRKPGLKPVLADPKDILVFDKQPAAPLAAKPALGKLPELKSPPQFYDTGHLIEQLAKGGMLKSENLQPGESFTLSPRRAWIEDRGWLDALNLLMVASDAPNFQFISQIGPGDDARHVDIWLRNLIPGRSYIAQVRVQAGNPGTFRISTGEGTRQTAPGGDRTIPVLLFQVQRELSLIRIESHGSSYWAFVDVQITALQPV